MIYKILLLTEKKKKIPTQANEGLQPLIVMQGVTRRSQVSFSWVVTLLSSFSSLKAYEANLPLGFILGKTNYSLNIWYPK